MSIEIVERSSGFWLVEETGVVDGPFETIDEAQHAWEEEQAYRRGDIDADGFANMR